jgi:hypothetical protein
MVALRPVTRSIALSLMIAPTRQRSILPAKSDGPAAVAQGINAMMRAGELRVAFETGARWSDLDRQHGA